METTANHDPKSLKRAWICCQELFSASTVREAARMFPALLEALPLWAMLLLPVIAIVIVTNANNLIVLLAAAAFLVAIYATVRKAVTDAIRQENRDSHRG